MIDQMTITLYTRVRSQGWRSQVWSALTGRLHCLLPLAKVDVADTVHARRCARIQTVPIRQIRGSEGRSLETLDYVVREMRSPQGAFYSTQDADSEGEEGKFFVWTVGEIRDVLGQQAEEFIPR